MSGPQRASLRALDVVLGAAGVTSTARELPGAALGGPAAALERLAGAEDGGTALTLAVGPCVVRGVPTAARLQLAARAPLGGGLAEGQVGSELAARVATLADLVVLSGSVPTGDGVLVLRESGVALLRRPAWRTLPAAARNRELEAELGPCGTLACGPAAHAGVPFANLTAGAHPGSRVGRGGLGRVLAERGLLAVAVVAEPVPTQPHHDLEAALRRSPRLRTRAARGTLELFGAAEEAAPGTGQRHGCHGCPTPCGIALDGGAGPARFSALEPLRTRFGPAADALLERCNELGLDAREAAARLRPGEEVDVLLTRPGPARALAPLARRDLTGRLAARVAARGSDPLRAFPFLTEAGPGRLAEVARGIPWPDGSEDGDDPRGAGWVVSWHEDLSASLDALGFCAFSAAALLADGVLGLDALAVALLPELADQEAPGARLQGLGADLVRMAHRARAALGGGFAEGAEPDLEAPLAAYRRWRGLDAEGRPCLDPEAPASGDGPAGIEPAALRESRPSGRVEVAVAATGRAPLDRASEGRLALEVPVPATGAELLRALAAREPGLAELLLDGEGRPIPAVVREGRPLAAGERVEGGDRIELVWVVPGG